MMEMDRGARGWMVNTARRSYWRVSSWYEFDDLLQDGLMCWVHINRKYPAVKDRAHMMRLFQMTFLNQITFIAKRQQSSKLEVPVDSFEFIPSVALRPIDVEVAQLIKDGPPCLQRLLETMNTDNGRRRLRALRRFINGRMESKNECLCRILSLDPKQVNVVEVIKKYLTQRDEVTA
jgi:hypothetical protein